MITTLSELELSCIDRLSREQLLAALRNHTEHLPGDLVERLDDQSTDQLRLLLLAGRLIRVLRQWGHRGPTSTPSNRHLPSADGRF
jgi:hypothetical protein